MPFLSFDSYPLWLNALVFAVSAGTIWFAGVRLERNAGMIAERTGIGHAFTGMVLLAATTSLPEVATTITAAAFLENPTLAVHNLIGGVALQTGILVAADWFKGRHGALTFFSPHFVLLIEGMGVLVLLQLTIAGVTARGFPSVFSIGVWSIVLLLAYLGLISLIYRYRGDPRWSPTYTGDAPYGLHAESGGSDARDQQESVDESSDPTEEDSRMHRHSMSRVWLLFAGESVLVLAGGWTAAQSADVLAVQTGLGSAFLGATFLALATSLPELSTTIAASRNRRYSMAISNVFGSNAFDITLLFLADVLHRGGTILEHGEAPLVFVAAIGAIMTCIYLWGLLERENRSVLGIGWDSAAALLVYLGAMVVLYFIT